MKRGKKLSILLVIAVGILMAATWMTGCKKVTAESLIKEAGENMSKAKSFGGNLLVDVELGMEQSGMSMGLNINADMDMEMVNEPSAMHLNGKLNIDLLNMKLDTEVYTVKEDGKNITYTKSGDSWKKSGTEIEKETKSSQMDLLKELSKEDLTLQKKTEKVNEKDAYVIKTSLTGKEFEKAAESMEEYLEKAKMEDADFSTFVVDVTIKIYKDNKLPASISFKVVDGLNDVLSSLTGTSEVNITMDKCIIEMNFDSYDKIKEITVPKEALAAEETSDSSDSLGDISGDSQTDSDSGETYTPVQPKQDENGNYMITGYADTALTVKTPEGYEYSDLSSERDLYFEKRTSNYEKSVNVSYVVDEVYENYERDVVDMAKERVENYTKDKGYDNPEFKDVQTFETGGLNVNYLYTGSEMEGFYMRDYVIWITLDEKRQAQCRVALSSMDKPIEIEDEKAFLSTFVTAIQP